MIATVELEIGPRNSFWFTALLSENKHEAIYSIIHGMSLMSHIMMGMTSRYVELFANPSSAVSAVGNNGKPYYYLFQCHSYIINPLRL